MRNIQRLLGLLYPPKWRARYGEEFSALLEELEPRPQELVNLFTGAIRMHMTEWSYLRFAIVFSVFGLVAGVVGQLTIHDKFLASAVISIPSEQKWAMAKQELFSRRVLWTVIEEQHLYRAECLRQPLEDVIDHMREKDLQANVISPSRMELTFLYPESDAAQQTVRTLLARVQPYPEFRVLGQPGSPDRVDPNRYTLFFTFFGATLLLGFMTAAVARRPSRFARTLGIYGLIGAAIACGGSLVYPEQYTSHAVVTCAEGERLRSYVLSNDQIAGMI